ncbi:MAG: hypothetical protein AB2693_15770 [Candidatus Thiodiazotropha sp.]
MTIVVYSDLKAAATTKTKTNAWYSLADVIIDFSDHHISSYMKVVNNIAVLEIIIFKAIGR